MRQLIARFGRETSGATALEYGLIAVLLGVALIVGATALGTGINSSFQGIADDNFGG